MKRMRKLTGFVTAVCLLTGMTGMSYAESGPQASLTSAGDDTAARWEEQQEKDMGSAYERISLGDKTILRSVEPGRYKADSAEDKGVVSLASVAESEDRILIDGVYYTYGFGTAAVAGYTEDIAEKLIVPETITVEGTKYEVTEIREAALMGCTLLHSVEISERTSLNVAESAFEGCDNLRSVSLPACTEFIGFRAFYSCMSLEAINVASGCENYYDDNGVLISGDKSVGSSVLVQYPLGKKDTSYRVPDGVTTIGYEAFSIGDYQYSDRSVLQSVDLNGVTEIQPYAFTYHSSLSSVDFGDKLETIGGEAFSICDLKEVNLPGTLKKIDPMCWLGNFNLKSFSVVGESDYYYAIDGVLFCNYHDNYGDRVEGKTLAAYPAGKENTSYCIPEGIEYIGEMSFEDARKLKKVTISSTVTTIEQNAFVGCQMESIVIPGNVKRIEDGVFQNMDAMKTITLCEGVEYLGTYIFGGCDSLEILNIPSTVTKIGYSDYSIYMGSCIGLKAINVDPANEYYSSVDGVLFNKEKTILCMYPASSLNESFEIPAAVTAVASGSFTGAEKLKSLTVEEGNTEFYAEDGVLYQDDILHTYPAGKTDESWQIKSSGDHSVTRIGENAFSANRHIRDLIIGEGILIIEGSTFKDCRNLRTVTLPESLQEIRYAAFLNSGVTKITIPSNVTEIEHQAFLVCDELEYVEFTGTSAPEIGYEFAGSCEKLEYVYVPEGTQQTYLPALAGNRIPTGIMVVEGKYRSGDIVEEVINGLSEQSSLEEINGAAVSAVRLTGKDSSKLSDENIIKIDHLFQAANKDLEIQIDDLTTKNVSVEGAAVASGLAEYPGKDGTVSGNVDIAVTEKELQGNEIFNLGFEMTVNGELMQLKSPVIVTADLPASPDGSQWTLVHLDSSDNVERVDFILSNDGKSISFRADSFSRYILLDYKLTEYTAFAVYRTLEPSSLFIAAYDENGKMTSVSEHDISSHGILPFETIADLSYKAFSLDEAGNSNGIVEIGKEW